MFTSIVCMTLLLAAGIGMFAWTATRRWRLMCVAASPANRFDHPAARIGRVLRYAFGQARMFRYTWAGIAHALIFGGFIILALRTIILAARGFSENPHFGFWLFDDPAPLGQAYLFLKDLIGALVILGVLYFLYVRLIVKPTRINLSTEGIVILCMILGLMVADMTYEGAGYVRDAAYQRPTFHTITPVASLLSIPLAALPATLVDVLHWGGFWAHTIIVLTFLNLLPYGKHFHVLTIIPQVYFSNPQPNGTLAPITDIEGKIERSETLGAKTAQDLSWKSVLDLYTCTECGRCSDHCPATRTGKKLSPKHLTLTLRDHMYENESPLLALLDARRTSKNGAAAPSDDSGVPINGFITHDGQKDETNGELIGSWVDPEVLWACTTCGACEQECPVFISYIDKIVDMRRNLVLEKGEFPAQLQNAFRGLESVGNPYSFDNAQRADWSAGLNIPLLADKPDAEVLYWVGCSPSFDDRARKIARATATLLQKAGVNFAILGPQECCTGDPARRAGNEYLFEILAKQNAETLKTCGVRKLVTTCPHCFNTHKNEYPAYGATYEVVHHTQFLAELLRDGRLKPTTPVTTTVAYHDACYLGRHNGEYDAPRVILDAIPGLTRVEPQATRDRGMCCGAGGAQMWKEEEHSTGPNAGKVNHARIGQLLPVLPAAGQPRTVASACPFCMTMLSDGLKDQGHTDVEQLDIAELLLKSISP